MVFYFTIPAKSSTVNISSAFTPVPGHIYGTGNTAPEGGFYGSCPARTYAQMSTYTSPTDSGKQTDYFLEVKLKCFLMKTAFLSRLYCASLSSQNQLLT